VGFHQRLTTSRSFDSEPEVLIIFDVLFTSESGAHRHLKNLSGLKGALTKSVDSPSSKFFLLFCPSSRLFSLFVSILSSFSFYFVFLRHRTFSRCATNFLFRQMPRLLFMIPGCSMNVLRRIPRFMYSSHVNYSYCCGLPNKWAPVVLGACGVDGCSVKQFHREIFFIYWIGICRY